VREFGETNLDRRKVIEEMAGSDRVPDPNDSKRAQVGKRKPTERAKWRSSTSAYGSALQNVLDTADIVRDGMFRQPS